MGVGVGGAVDQRLGSPLLDLPGVLNQGFLMNEPAGQLQFVPNPLTPVTSASGGWYSTALGVQVSYTGVTPFLQGPIYFSYSPTGLGTAMWDYPP